MLKTSLSVALLFTASVAGAQVQTPKQLNQPQVQTPQQPQQPQVLTPNESSPTSPVQNNLERERQSRERQARDRGVTGNPTDVPPAGSVPTPGSPGLAPRP
jgi:hypothetical protein